MRHRSSNLVLALGLTISVLSLLYLFVNAEKASQRVNGTCCDLSSLNTVTHNGEKIIVLVFALLNAPAFLLLLTLEASVPLSSSAAHREFAIYSAVAIAVVGWWWLLAKVWDLACARRQQRIAAGISVDAAPGPHAGGDLP